MGALHAEYERKWLLARLPEVAFTRSLHMRQGYITQNGVWVRIRETTFSDGATQCILNRKIPIDGGSMEWEVPIPQGAFDMLWTLCDGHSLIKTRREFVDARGWLWEIDAYEGPLAGLFVLELELPAPDAEFSIPKELADCILREVTGDPAWTNKALSCLRSLPEMPFTSSE